MHCVIVGASHAAAQLVASLRQLGWTGPLTLIGEENLLPYQRPPLSKAFLSGELDEDKLLIRPSQAYEKLDVELKLGLRVQQIDRTSKQLQLSNGEQLSYDKLVLCTGARPRLLPLAGAELPQVHYLRNAEDAQQIQQQLKVGSRVIIIGGGYIGLETAASLKKLGAEVTVLEAAERILQRVTAAEVSNFYQQKHQREGVKVLDNVQLECIKGEHKVESVIASDGTEFPADMVIVGIGVLPNVELAEEAGLTIDNGIVVDEQGRSSDMDIFSAGDCCSYPHPKLKRQLRLESVPSANDTARIIASTLCNKPLPNVEHPWFWSDQYEIKLQIAGFNMGYTHHIVRGNPEEENFSVWYFREGELIAADCINRPKDFMAAKQLLKLNAKLNAEQLSDENVELKTLIEAAKAPGPA
ncbi:NAD(P)/FAD-dependent oxidoreductase [Pseudoteredinibacter isoporae]|uniref:3-phenylpropionate/trans-cinnamate dioxygenase ferredoxin reductase subunit n=1 Tax=Pseudoteredinibacter isoporae TaxID=570281 RepID=A0A7X0JR38_9GAMM|nr:FAD-dependent oxidoreductase [Pseudoteredinibacter isoporae]MBB6520730.1 3-phenylpropionate/trans-cinnamate dioxygenase ferredoxin reductase subunit [Pseudoteredinibacter isoporae]NHO86297.1 FAD-dependent oxidoreductase [Pseudoteredinibacter isoporae]NIB25252.1 FAD-dependent oxidoreductase [Pseudoteredinibacter isoporae]